MTRSDAGLAEEPVQETFLRAWRAGERFDPQIGSLRAWLFAILRNVVIDLGRARSSRPPLAEGGIEPAVGFSLRSPGIFDGLASLGLSISENKGEVLL